MRLCLLPLCLATALVAAAGASLAECRVPASISLCGTCHALAPGKPSRATGPNLVGVPGQAAMHAADFKGYSEAMKAASAKGLVWTDDNLMSYLADPKAFLATFNGRPLKNAMSFQLTDEAKRKAAVAGLKEISACP